MIGRIHIRHRVSRTGTLAAMLFLVTGCSAQARDITVTKPQELAASLAKAAPGNELVLAPGDYGALTLKSGVSLRSADPKAPARFSGVTGEDVTNVVLRNLDIGRTRGAEPEFAKIVELRGGGGIRIEGGQIHGSRDGNPQNDMWGLYARNVRGLTISGVKFQEHDRAIVIDGSSDVRIERNDITGLQTDGIDLAGAQGVTIEGNRIGDFHPVEGDHPDAVQAWTTSQTTGVTNLTVRNNFFESSVDGRMQGVFLGDELELWKNGKGHRHVTIEGNVIVNPMWNAIMADQVEDTKVVNNIVLNQPGGPPVSGGPVFPWIKVGEGASLAGNSAPRYIVGGKHADVPGNRATGNDSSAGAVRKLRDEWLTRFRGN